MVKKGKYIGIVLLFVCVFLYLEFREANLLERIELYFETPKDVLLTWKLNFKSIDEINFFSYMGKIFQSYFRRDGTDITYRLAAQSLMSLFIPFIVIFSSFRFIDRQNKINRFIYYRLKGQKTYFSFALKEVFKEGIRTAMPVYGTYVAYVLFLTIVYGFGTLTDDSTGFLINSFTINLFRSNSSIF